MGGSLRIAVMRDPSGEWDPVRGDHHLDLDLEREEWEDLFFAVLGAPAWEAGLLENEGVFAYEERQKRNFETYLKSKGFEMLGRISDMYQDAEYEPSEVAELREECSRVEELTDNAEVLEGVRKLVFACNEAVKIGSGLILLSD
ncbi:MAG: hypothetical protein ABI791_04985 [Acidobacteriota bacterium]